MKIFIFLTILVLVKSQDDLIPHPIMKQPHPDEVFYLPGIPEFPTFKMYAGQVSVENEQVFYWLNEQKDMDDGELIVNIELKINDSPLHALFKEHGYFIFDEYSATLKKNEFAWNNFASTVYMEIPLKTQLNLSSTVNETATANLIVASLKTILNEVHVKFANHKFYLSGNGEASVYISHAAEIIMQLESLKDQFKGVIFGNAMFNCRDNKKVHHKYLYHNGLLEKEVFQNLQFEKCYSSEYLATVEGREKCEKSEQAYESVMKSINPKNINEPCYKNIKTEDVEDEFIFVRHLPQNNAPYAEEVLGRINEQPSEKEVDLYDESDFQYDDQIEEDDYFDGNEQKDYLSGNFSRKNSNVTVEVVDNSIETDQQDNENFLDVSCESNKNLMNYLKKQELFIKYNMTTSTSNSKEPLNQVKRPQLTDVTLQISKLLQNNKTALLYYGDLDVVNNYIAGELFVRRFNELKTSSRKVFYNRNRDSSKSFAGLYENYGENFKFAIIKNAGHWANKDQPESTFNLVYSWIVKHRF